MIDLNQFGKWGSEKNSRSVQITVKDNKTQVFVYDTAYMVGQMVQSVDEIDLIGEAIRDQERTLERLRQLKELKDETNSSPNPN